MKDEIESMSMLKTLYADDEHNGNALARFTCLGLVARRKVPLCRNALGQIAWTAGSADDIAGYVGYLSADGDRQR